MIKELAYASFSGARILYIGTRDQGFLINICKLVNNHLSLYNFSIILMMPKRKLFKANFQLEVMKFAREHHDKRSVEREYSCSEKIVRHWRPVKEKFTKMNLRKQDR